MKRSSSMLPCDIYRAIPIYHREQELNPSTNQGYSAPLSRYMCLRSAPHTAVLLSLAESHLRFTTLGHSESHHSLNSMADCWTHSATSGRYFVFQMKINKVNLPSLLHPQKQYLSSLHTLHQPLSKPTKSEPVWLSLFRSSAAVHRPSGYRLPGRYLVRIRSRPPSKANAAEGSFTASSHTNQPTKNKPERQRYINPQVVQWSL